MSWFKVDDGFITHPKVFGIKSGPLALWLRAGCWCAGELTDGRMSARALKGLNAKPEHVKELVDRGLWEPFEDGFQFHDWLDYQPSRDQVLKSRNETLRRVRKHRNAVTNADVTPAPGPVPVPEKKEECVSSQYERPPLPEPPPELEPAEPPLTADLLNEHARMYADRRSGEVPMRNYRAALSLAKWCTQNAHAHRCSPLELGKRVLAGLFENAKAGTKRWPMSWAAQDPAEYISSPLRPVAYVEPKPLVSPEKVAELQRAWEERQLAKHKAQVAS